MSACPELKTPIRVCVIDDDLNIQQALKQAIDGRVELLHVGSAHTLQEGLALLKQVQPDIALVDLGLGVDSGLQLIEYIQQHMPHCESLVLTVFGDEAHVITSIEAGATGYLTKDTEIGEIVNRLQLMQQGGSPISPIIARRLLSRLRQSPAATDLQPPADNPQAEDSEALLAETPQLSERETEVLEMVSRGFMQAEIADLLGVSLNTVSTYVKRTYKKLAVNSRMSAIRKARQLGLIANQDNKPKT